MQTGVRRETGTNYLAKVSSGETTFGSKRVQQVAPEEPNQFSSPNLSLMVPFVHAIRTIYW